MNFQIFEHERFVNSSASTSWLSSCQKIGNWFEWGRLYNTKYDSFVWIWKLTFLQFFLERSFFLEVSREIKYYNHSILYL